MGSIQGMPSSIGWTSRSAVTRSRYPGTPSPGRLPARVARMEQPAEQPERPADELAEPAAERRAPYDPMPHGPVEVGVGPWSGPWPGW